MIKRKDYLINKDFQLKKSIKLISSVFVIIAVIIIAAIIVILTNNNQVKTNNAIIANNINGLKQNIEIEQDKLINDLLKPDNKLYKDINNKSDMLITEFNKSMDTHNNSIKSNEYMMIMEANRNIILTNTRLFITVILVAIAGIAILFFTFIRQTHRIAGPLFLMSRYAKEILNGGSPDMRELREKDEFKDFYVIFKQMAGRIIELEKKSADK